MRNSTTIHLKIALISMEFCTWVVRSEYKLTYYKSKLTNLHFMCIQTTEMLQRLIWSVLKSTLQVNYSAKIYTSRVTTCNNVQSDNWVPAEAGMNCSDFEWGISSGNDRGPLWWLCSGAHIACHQMAIVLVCSVQC